MKKENKKSIKKIYDRPKLIIYGDFSKITQAVFGSGMNDGGGHGNPNKTG